MSRSRRKLNILITLVLLMLAVLSVVGAVSSYFSASTHKDGQLNFSRLSVEFAYKDDKGQLKKINNGSELGTLTLYPNVETVIRNEPFKLKVEGATDAISSILIMNNENSCSAYVRFWIEAYIVDSNGDLGTKNYGKYFLLSDSSAYTKQNSSVSGADCYYVINAISAENNVDLGNQLKISDLTGDSIPDDLLGAKLKVTISFDAVQSANGAFKSVFGAQDDKKGYYTDWS